MLSKPPPLVNTPFFAKIEGMKVIKIGAVWCPGCLVMRPRWQEVEKKLEWLETEYLDYDEDESEVKKYNLKEGKLPVFIFLDKSGQEITRLQGEYSKEKLVEVCNKYKDK